MHIGILLLSTAVLIAYIAYTNNNPFVNNKIIAPSLFAGLLWAMAQLAWFFANDLLSQVRCGELIRATTA